MDNGEPVQLRRTQTGHGQGRLQFVHDELRMLDCAKPLLQASVGHSCGPVQVETQFTERSGHERREMHQRFCRLLVAPQERKPAVCVTLRAGISKMEPECVEKIAVTLQQYSIEMSDEVAISFPV